MLGGSGDGGGKGRTIFGLVNVDWSNWKKAADVKLSPLNTGSARLRGCESLGATVELKTRSGCQDARVWIPVT